MGQRRFVLPSSALVLVLAGCPGSGSQAGEVGSSSTSEETTGTETSSDTETGSGTETSSGTEETTGEDTGLPDESMLPPPAQAQAPCEGDALPPDALIGAYAEYVPNDENVPGRLHFLRADGSSELVREDPFTNHAAVARGDRVLVAQTFFNCTETSTLAMHDRAGALVWDGLEVARVERMALQEDGRAVLLAYPCDDPEPRYAVIEDGQILDEGLGEPVYLQVLDDDWLPLYRPLFADNPAKEQRWRWRNVVTKEEREVFLPYAEGLWTPLFLAGGELLYLSDIEGARTLVVDSLGSAEFVDAPILAELAAEGWTFMFPGYDSGVSNRYPMASEWALIEATGPDEQTRWFALSPERELDEITPEPPPGQEPADCGPLALDPLGRPLLPWFDGQAAWTWHEQTPGEWTRLGVAMVGVGKIRPQALWGGSELVTTDPFGCALPWAEPPPPYIVDARLQYVRADAALELPDQEGDRLGPSGRCVAYAADPAGASTTFGNDWTIHELETNAAFALPDEWGFGRLFWLAD